jgi:predicted transcriptional regulator
MIMQTAKQEAIEAISHLPDTADIEEIMYRLYVLENIRHGQEDATQGKNTTAEQVLRDVQTW